MPSYNRVVTRYQNGTTEVIDYEIPQEYGYTRIKKDNNLLKSNGRVKLGRKKDKKSDFKEINVFKNSVRAQKKIRQLCNNNPLLLHKFITLTFAAVFKEHDIKQANYLYKKFCQRLEYFVRKNIPDFKLEYLCVPELTKEGNIHYHMLCNIPFIDIKLLQNIWNYGIVYINKIEDIENVAAYISSYVEKDFGIALAGSKHFLKSSGVVYPVPEKLMSNDDKVNYNFDNLTYSSKNSNFYCGQVDTRIYDVNSRWE